MKTTTPLYVVGNELADAKYGPYLTTTQALNLLPIEDRKIGQTVGVYDGTGIVEYWFKDGIEDIDLIAKTSGGGSGDMLKATYDIDDDGVVDSAETVKIIVRNSTGSTLTKGQIVYLSGATGNRPNAVLADATDEATSSKTIGMVSANIANNADGYVAVSGTLHDLDTSSFTAGNSLWLSETAGAMQANTPPAEPAHAVFIGYVARSHPTQGRIVLAIQNGYELTELHGVTITSPATNDFLYYASDGIWKNKQLSATDINANVSNTEFGYLDGVTSAIQTQLNSKAADSAVVHNTGTETVGGAKTFSSLLTASAGVSITPPTGSGADKVGTIVSGSNTNGGTDYLDFLKATNTAAGATNINKYFRLNSTGQIEIVNSAYTGVIFTLTDTGTLNGATQAEMGYLSGVTSAIQTQINALPRVVYTNYTAETTTSTTTTNALTTFTLTIADANWPLGGLLRLSGLMERTAGTGSVLMGVVINGSTARYVSSSGQNTQWEWTIIKEAANTLRIGMGPSNTNSGSYTAHNQSTVTATASGGNYVFTFYMFVNTAGATGSMRWMKGIMIP